MSGAMGCAVCGGTEFRARPVIWDALAAGWGLTPEERRLMDLQQGCCCTACGANLRSAALARAILDAAGFDGTLNAFVDRPEAAGLVVLEVNEAGTLTPVLGRLPGHRLVRYPEVDLQALPYEDGRFDLVVHSDTLEHVPDPRRALAESRRVLRRGGALCFTIPILPRRLTRSLAGGPALYHGNPQEAGSDLLVHTDFGADAWDMVLAEGFTRVDLTRLREGLALTAWNGRPAPLAPMHMDQPRGTAVIAGCAPLHVRLAAALRRTASRVARLARPRAGAEKASPSRPWC